MFFPASSEKFDKLNLKAEKDFKKLPTFILCNPNAMHYQHMINYPHAFYLRFFLQKNINVMCWNYRGYARSKGRRCCTSTPNPDNIREDAEQVLAYCKRELGLRGKIGVYGRSLGGIATTHLAEFVDMVIVDRSFSDLYEVAFHKFHGKLATALFKVGTIGWDSHNDIRMTERGIESEERRAAIHKLCGFVDGAKKEDDEAARWSLEPSHSPKSCYKVMTCDANDDIVVL